MVCTHSIGIGNVDVGLALLLTSTDNAVAGCSYHRVSALAYGIEGYELCRAIIVLGFYSESLALSQEDFYVRWRCLNGLYGCVFFGYKVIVVNLHGNF